MYSKATLNGRHTNMRKKQSYRLKESIEEEIVTGILKPGERLEEISLAERFGVSRTPIREALQQLAATGLVDIRPHRGAIVGAPDPIRLSHMFELMAEMEAMCGRLAARRLRNEDEIALKETLLACQKAVKTRDTDKYYFENERFHRAIYTASGNPFILEQVLALSKRLAPYRRLQLRVRNRMTNSVAEHEAIVKAILTGKAEEAARQLTAHVSIQGQRFIDLMASMVQVIDQPDVKVYNAADPVAPLKRRQVS
jgi:DNA-binding GntR family transcriptional regulator